MDVRGEVAHRRFHAAVQRAAIRQMSTQAHTRRTYTTIARGQ